MIFPNTALIFSFNDFAFVISAFLAAVFVGVFYFVAPQQSAKKGALLMATLFLLSFVVTLFVFSKVTKGRVARFEIVHAG